MTPWEQAIPFVRNPFAPQKFAEHMHWSRDRLARQRKGSTTSVRNSKKKELLHRCVHLDLSTKNHAHPRCRRHLFSNFCIEGISKLGPSAPETIGTFLLSFAFPFSGKKVWLISRTKLPRGALSLRNLRSAHNQRVPDEILNLHCFFLG